MVKYLRHCKRYIIAALLLVSSVAVAQTSNLTGTVTDSDGIAWANATWTAKIFNPSGGPLVYIGSGLPVPANPSGALNASGAFSGTLPDNSKIVAPGTQWVLTICSNTSAPCQTLDSVIVSGVSFDMGSVVSASITAPRFAGGSNAHGYSNIEISPLIVGSTFFSVTDGTYYVYNGVAWTSNNLTIVNYCSFLGMHCDGVSDDTSAFNALLLSLYNSGGGTIIGSCGKTSLISGQITLPNNNATFPSQHGIKIEGCGSNSPFAQASLGGAFTLDMKYNAPVAKIITLGTGTLEISGVNFVDDGADCSTFVFDSNTTLYIHNNTFNGTTTGTGACNDAIILGGTDPSTRAGTNASFQGYGTTIRENTFNKIRRAVFGQNWSNGVIVRDNAITSNSGYTTGAAIQFSSTYVVGFDNGLSGEQIQGNIIESNNYEYGIVLGTSGANGYSVSDSYLAGNNCYDHGGSFSTCVFIQGVTATSGGGNVVIAGLGDPSTPYTDVSADSIYNTFINGANGLLDTNLINGKYSVTSPRLYTQGITVSPDASGIELTNAHNGTTTWDFSNAGATTKNEIDLNFKDNVGGLQGYFHNTVDGTNFDVVIGNSSTTYTLCSLIFDGTLSCGNAGKSSYIHGGFINFDSGAAFTNGPTPVYTQTGTNLQGHISTATGSLVSGGATVTWSGSAAFSSNMTCTASDETAVASIKVHNNSGTSVTLTGTGTDQYQLVCVGD